MSNEMENKNQQTKIGKVENTNKVKGENQQTKTGKVKNADREIERYIVLSVGKDGNLITQVRGFSLIEVLGLLDLATIRFKSTWEMAELEEARKQAIVRSVLQSYSKEEKKKHE